MVSPLSQLIQRLDHLLDDACSLEKVKVIVEQNKDAIEAEIVLCQEIQAKMEQLFALESTKQIIIDAHLNAQNFKTRYCNDQPIIRAHRAIEEAWKAKEEHRSQPKSKFVAKLSKKFSKEKS